MIHISRERSSGRADIETCPIKKTADEEIVGVGMVHSEGDWDGRGVLTIVEAKEG
jgi:hypothetical protein